MTGPGAMTAAQPHPVTWFDAAGEAELRELLVACLDVPSWVDTVIAGRPYDDRATLLAAADRAAAGIEWDEVARALARHPRIGERRAAAGQTGRESGWSMQEQAAVGRSADGGQEQPDALRAGNLNYEKRFGHIFLICAMGLTRDEILAALRSRLSHDAQTEKVVVVAELGKIAALRLGRAIGPDQRAGSDNPR